MQFLLSLIGFIFLSVTVAFAVLVWKVRRRMKSFRDAMQDGMDEEAFRRMADKNYYRNHRDDEVHFDDEYFKGDPDGSRQRRQQQGRQQQPSRRTTRTADGLTIIDNRDAAERDKKIFAQDEGEYVDFKES